MVRIISNSHFKAVIILLLVPIGFLLGSLHPKVQVQGASDTTIPVMYRIDPRLPEFMKRKLFAVTVIIFYLQAKDILVISINSKYHKNK